MREEGEREPLEVREGKGNPWDKRQWKGRGRRPYE